MSLRSDVSAKKTRPEQKLRDIVRKETYCRSTWGDIDFVASEGTIPAAVPACFATIYSKPERVIARPALFRKSAVLPGVVTLSNEGRGKCRSWICQTTVVIARQVLIATARKARCVRADVRWR
jgi:hypothetical protein